MGICKGETALGNPCRRKAGDDGFCWSHSPGKEEEASESAPFRPDEMDADGYMTQAAFARLLQVADGAVHSYTQRGIIEKRADGKIHVATALKRLNSRGAPMRSDSTRRVLKPTGSGKVVEIEPERAAPSSDGDLNTKKLIAQIDGLVQKARLHEMKADQQAGKLVLRDVVDRQVFAAARVVRGQIFNIADRCAGELAGLDTPADIHARLTEEIRAVLTDLADAIEALEFDDEQ